MLCRLYVDETGNSDLRNAGADGNVRFLSLTGVLTYRQVHAEIIQPQLDELKADLFGHSEDNPVILHRRDVIDREGPFVVLNDEDVRANFDAKILDLIRTLPYIAITVTIDKAEHLEKYGVWHFDPYHYCLRCLVERYVLWLNRHRWTGDVVIEPRFKKVDKKVKASFQRIWAGGTENIPARIVQARLTSHEIKFVGKGENCAGLQLCDLIAHPSFRAMRRRKEGQNMPHDFGASVVAVLEESKLSRNPKTGVIEGWGRKWLP
jgi:Protein of unknown function (DUF3800)